MEGFELRSKISKVRLGGVIVAKIMRVGGWGLGI